MTLLDTVGWTSLFWACIVAIVSLPLAALMGFTSLFCLSLGHLGRRLAAWSPGQATGSYPSYNSRSRGWRSWGRSDPEGEADVLLDGRRASARRQPRGGTEAPDGDDS